MQQDDIQLQKRFEELPDEIAVALASPDLLEKVDRIARTYSLGAEDTENLEILVSMVFLGENHIANFKQEVIDIIDMPEDLGATLADDIYAEVLSPYEEDLIEVGDFYANQNEEGEIAETQEEPVQASAVESTPITSTAASTQTTTPVPEHVMDQPSSLDFDDPEAILNDAIEPKPEIRAMPTIQQHILDEIEHPTPSPLVSSSTGKAETASAASAAPKASTVPPATPAQHITFPKLNIPAQPTTPRFANVQPHDLPQARVVPPISPSRTIPSIKSTPAAKPIAPMGKPAAIKVPPMPPKPKVVSAPAPTSAPTPVVKAPEPIPEHNLDMLPAIPEHTEEELMPLIIEQSKKSQQK